MIGDPFLRAHPMEMLLAADFGEPQGATLAKNLEFHRDEHGIHMGKTLQPMGDDFQCSFCAGPR